jgi:hypothetical protein
MLSKLLKWMRIDDKLPWEALEDRSRTAASKRGYENMKQFIHDEIDDFLEGYTRCLVQGQEKYIEVWTEKDALFRVFENVVWPYCIRAVVCRGYQSVTFIADFYKRATQALMRGQKPVVLYFGDLDPSGVQMLEATIETLVSELGLWGVEFKRVALNPEHIKDFNLPHDPTAAKKSDSRYKGYVKKYGKVAVELDALHPALLEEIIIKAIEDDLDMGLFEKEKEQEEEDQYQIEVLREQLMDAMKHNEEEMFD